MRALLLVVLAAGTAHAQAPGQVPAQPVAPAAPSVMDDRWSASLGLMSEGLTPKSSGSNTQFGGVELAGHYRFTPALQLGLSFLGAGSAGNLSTVGIFIDMHYRFFPDNPWNLYALGSLGVAGAADNHANTNEQKARGALRLGLGGERRFGHVGIDAELFLVHVGANTVPPTPRSTSSATAQKLERDALNGGALVVGATFYF